VYIFSLLLAISIAIFLFGILSRNASWRMILPWKSGSWQILHSSSGRCLGAGGRSPLVSLPRILLNRALALGPTLRSSVAPSILVPAAVLGCIGRGPGERKSRNAVGPRKLSVFRNLGRGKRHHRLLETAAGVVDRSGDARHGIAISGWQ
jgi:hypothetical protein